MVFMGVPVRKGRTVSIETVAGSAAIFTLATNENDEPLPVTVYTPQVESTPFRIVGTQQRSDNRKVNKHIFDNWSRGMGHTRIRRASGQGVGGFRDSDALTLHRSAVYPGILHEAQTHVYPASHIKKYVNFKGDLFGFFERDYANDGHTTVECSKWNPDVWDAAGQVENALPGGHTPGMRCYDAIAHKNYMWAAVTNDGDDALENSIVIARSLDGSTWEETGTSTQVTFDGINDGDNRTNTIEDEGARLLSFGNTLMIAVHDQNSAEIQIHYSTNPEASSPTFTAGAVIPDDGSRAEAGPKAFFVWSDRATVGNPDTPILVTANGIYRVDSAGTTYDLLFPLDGDTNNGRWSVTGMDGAMWVPLGSGEILRLSIEGDNVLVANFVKPPDGLVSARQGHANCLLTPPVPWLIVAYGGHAAGKTASIFAIDYRAQRDPVTGRMEWPWHSLYSEADDNIDLYLLGYSGEDDATPRLHFALEHADAAEMYHLEEPFTDPSSGVTQKFQTTSFIEWPEDDMGDPHVNSIVLTGRLDAGEDLDNVSTIEGGGGNANDIEHEYGVNGAAWNNVSNLGFYASDDLVLLFGKTNQNTPSASEAGTPIGVSAKTVRHRHVLNRDGTSTNKVSLKEFQVEAHNLTQDLKGFRIPIDIYATALEQEVDPEVIDDRIDSIIEATTLIALVFGEETDGTGTTYYVKAEAPSSREMLGALPEGTGIGATTERSKNVGIVQLQLEEMQGDT